MAGRRTRTTPLCSVGVLHQRRTIVNSDTLLFDLADHVAVITLNRPAVRNAMNRALSEALLAALQRVRDDADIRVAVITGAGSTFSAGADLKERAQHGRAADASAASIIATSHAGGVSTLAIPKPLLAAVDGYCLAAGFELALLCDMRICTPEARFGLPEITRGFFPGGGGPQRLMRAIPQAMAMEMLLTGRSDSPAPPAAPLMRRWSTPCVSVARCGGLSARPRMRVKGRAPSPSAGPRATKARERSRLP